jgi:hypothetical protein
MILHLVIETLSLETTFDFTFYVNKAWRSVMHYFINNRSFCDEEEFLCLRDIDNVMDGDMKHVYLTRDCDDY